MTLYASEDVTASVTVVAFYATHILGVGVSAFSMLWHTAGTRFQALCNLNCFLCMQCQCPIALVGAYISVSPKHFWVR
jgi:hypothetical protein